MRLSTDEVMRRGALLAKCGGITTFGKTAMTCDVYITSSTKDVKITIYDYDKPITTICYHYSCHDEQYTLYYVYKYPAWRYSRTTTAHTKDALKIVSRVHEIVFGDVLPPQAIFDMIDEQKITEYFGLI